MEIVNKKLIEQFDEAKKNSDFNTDDKFLYVLLETYKAAWAKVIEARKNESN